MPDAAICPPTRSGNDSSRKGAFHLQQVPWRHRHGPCKMKTREKRRGVRSDGLIRSNGRLKKHIFVHTLLQGGHLGEFPSWEFSLPMLRPTPQPQPIHTDPPRRAGWFNQSPRDAIFNPGPRSSLSRSPHAAETQATASAPVTEPVPAPA